MNLHPQLEQQEEQEKDNVVSFTPKLVTGGKEPPTNNPNDWLSPLPVGQIFLAKAIPTPQNISQFLLPAFRVARKTEKTVYLESPEHPNQLPVDPIAFCRVYRQWELDGILISPAEAKAIIAEEQDERDRLQPDARSSNEQLEGHAGEQEKHEVLPKES